jgi:hypothetical protein
MTERNSLVTVVNYYDDPGDGSPPTPVYIGPDKTVSSPSKVPSGFTRYKPETEESPANGFPRSQVINERRMTARQVVVQDVTGKEDEFSLDTHGFQYHRHESSEKGFGDEARIREVYFPECEQLLCSV